MEPQALVKSAHAKSKACIVCVEHTGTAGYDPDGLWRAVGSVSLNMWVMTQGHGYQLAVARMFSDESSYHAALDALMVPGISSTSTNWQPGPWSPELDALQGNVLH